MPLARTWLPTRFSSPGSPAAGAATIRCHFNADVLWPRGDTSWILRRSEILNWLDLHDYLEPIT